MVKSREGKQNLGLFLSLVKKRKQKSMFRSNLAIFKKRTPYFLTRSNPSQFSIFVLEVNERKKNLVKSE